MVSDALKRLMRERKLREDEALAEREHRRLAEVKAAFYEGMAAGNDAFWQERPADDYWLESDARRDLYAGPPLPPDPSKRAALMMKGARSRFPYRHDRDPERVIGGRASRKRKPKT